MRFDILHANGLFPVGSYEIDPMPGCPRVGISHALQINEGCRGIGYGTRAMDERIEKARELGYEVLIATVVAGNVAEEKILERFKWRPITTFDNLKTGHTVNLWVKNINDPYETDWIGGCR